MASYVEKDLNILRSEFDVQECYFRGLRDIVHLWKGIRQCDIIFSWFGKLHAFFAVLIGKIYKKKVIVVAGGNDVANVPEINYGLFCHPLKKWCPLIVFKYADKILPVSKFNKQETIENARANPCKIKLVYHGFDKREYRRIENTKKEDIALTVAFIYEGTIIKKGLELFVKSAQYLPEVRFVLVGPSWDHSIEHLKNIASANVEFSRETYGDK